MHNSSTIFSFQLRTRDISVGDFVEPNYHSRRFKENSANVHKPY